MNRRPPVLKLRRLAGVSGPERSEGERESAAGIPSEAREQEIGGSVSESNRPEPGKTRLTPVLKTGMITGPHALPRGAH